MEQTLNNLKALNAQQEKDVERVRLRDNLLRKVCSLFVHHSICIIIAKSFGNTMIILCLIVPQAELMKKKLPWLKFDMMRKEFREVIEEQEKIAKEKMEEAARIWEDSKGPIEYVPWFQKVSFIHFGHRHFF